MNNFEIVKIEDGYLMYVDGEYHEVSKEALVMTLEQREAAFDVPRNDPKVTPIE